MQVKAVESEGKLVLKFPKANRISNGQRDLISLFSKLFYFKNRIKAGKRYLLIIDEVFDYLDDANFIASQYYLSEIVNTKKAPVYVIILTHLSPRYFHSNIFSSKKLNMQFLDKKLSIDNSPLVDVIAFRNKQDNNSKLYNDISAYIFHFNSEAKELKEDFINQHASQIALKYSSSESIHKYVFQQLSQYENNETYDCIGVALAIRLKVEETFYNKISDDTKKNKFIEIHTTKKKLDYVEDTLQMEIPDAYRLLSPIYNHLHETSDFYRIASALTNKVVQRLISKVTNNKMEGN